MTKSDLSKIFWDIKVNLFKVSLLILSQVITDTLKKINSSKNFEYTNYAK